MAVVKANYCQKGAGERNLAKANISYIQTRPGRNKEQLTRTLFGAAGHLGRYEAYQFITDAPTGTYFYRLKLSPDPNSENLKRDLNMKKLTRQMMRNLEKRLHAPIPWAAAVHDDHTAIPHSHILAAIPKRLNEYELAFLITEATRLTLLQRRWLERGVSRLPWQEPEAQPTLKTGTYTSLSLRSHHRKSLPVFLPRWGRPPKIAHSSCTCPRCHMPQSHDRYGVHSCLTCGLALHQKKAQRLQRVPRKGRGLERSR